MGIYNTNLSERLGSYQDRIFDAAALPNASNMESLVFRFAKTQGQVELAFFANTEIVVADGETMTIELFWDDSETGSFTNSRVIYAAAPSGAALTIPITTEFALETPETDTEHWAKVKVTTSADQSTQKLDGKLFRTAV